MYICTEYTLPNGLRDILGKETLELSAAAATAPTACLSDLDVRPPVPLIYSYYVLHVIFCIIASSFSVKERSKIHLLQLP